MTKTSDFLTALPERAVIAVSGADARTFLQRVITRGPEDLREGGAQLSALLTPQGKILCEFIVFDDGEGGLLIDAPESEVDGLIKRFTLYKMRANAGIERRGDLAVAAALGAGEAELTKAALVATRDPRSDTMGLRAIAPADSLPSQPAAYHSARIAAGCGTRRSPSSFWTGRRRCCSSGRVASITPPVSGRMPVARIPTGTNPPRIARAGAWRRSWV